MEADSEMIAIILLALGVATLLLVTGGDDGDDGGDDEEFDAGSPGTEGEDGIPTFTLGGGDNTISNGTSEELGDSEGFDLSASQRVFAGAGDDVVFIGGGDDTVFGQSGDDSLDGSTGNDSLYGGPGSDIVIGGFGDDIMVLGHGADQIISDELTTSIVDALSASSLSGADTAMNDLESDLYKEMGGDDNILGGDHHTVDGLDSADTIIDLIGFNEINGAVGHDVIVTIDRDSTADGVPPKGDTVSGGYGQDEIWADDGDVVTLDPDPSEDHQVEDHLVIANILSGRGEVADDADGTFNSNDYVTVTDFDPAVDKLTVLSDTLSDGDLTFVADGSNVMMMAGTEVLAIFQNADVADFAGFSPAISSTTSV